jgi:hypothetical protein
MGGPRSLCSTVERLLAWEKKLYDEVKVSFAPQIEWLWFLSEKLELLFYNLFFFIIFSSLYLLIYLTRLMFLGLKRVLD